MYTPRIPTQHSHDVYTVSSIWTAAQRQPASTVAAAINEEFKLELDINSASKERRRGALSLSGTNGSRVDQEGSSAFPK